MKVIVNNAVKSFYDAWVTKEKPSQKEIKEINDFFKKLTDPIVSDGVKIWILHALMQSGKTNIMVGVGLKWLDRYTGSRVWLFTGHNTNEHRLGLRNAVEKALRISSRLVGKFTYVDPHQINGPRDSKMNDVRENDLVFWDEDHAATSLKTKTRYSALVDTINPSRFVLVGATNFSALDSITLEEFQTGILHIHKISQSPNYRGVKEAYLNARKNGKFIAYSKDDVDLIVSQFVDDYNTTKKPGVYILRLTPKKVFTSAISILDDANVPIVMAMLPNGVKAGIEKEIYNNGLEMVGLNPQSKPSIKDIISKVFEYSKFLNEDGTPKKPIFLIVDRTLGLGANIDKWVDFDAEYIDYSLHEEDGAGLYGQNKPFIRGVLETSSNVASILQGLLGRACRYVDKDGIYKPILEEWFNDMLISCNEEGLLIGLEIQDDLTKYWVKQHEYFERLRSAQLGLYTDFDMKLDEQMQDFTSASYVSNVLNINKESQKVESILNEYSNQIPSVNIPVLVSEIKNVIRSKMIPRKNTQSDNVSMTKDFYHNIPIIGSYKKFRFRHEQGYNNQPQVGVSFHYDQNIGLTGNIRLYIKGKQIDGFTAYSSLHKTAIRKLATK
jgi:hypothetical protein